MRSRAVLGAALALLLASLWLPQLVRERPWIPALPRQPLALDGLSAFFLILMLGGACLALLCGERPLRLALALPPLALAYLAVPLPLGALGLGLAAAAGWATSWRAAEHEQGRRGWRLWLSGPIDGAPGPGWLLPPLLLLATALLLRQSGSWRYDSMLAGAGLNAASFTTTLAATILGLVQLSPRVAVTPLVPLLLAPAWAYPLTRLYALGPWNSGWHSAALLLFGALLVWSALAAFAARDLAACRGLLARVALSLALLALCLGSSAGLAAACFALLAALPLIAALFAPPASDDEAELPRWFLTPAMPLSAPFVATWASLAAAAASGAFLATPLIWISALLAGITLALRRGLARAGWPLAALSLCLGIASPLLLRALVDPLVEQLQGGLSPFGELRIWPWVGLAALDSQRREVAALPSVAVAGLLLVLIAIIYLLARLLGARTRPEVKQATAVAAQPSDTDEESLWLLLRRQVFWLGAGREGAEAQD